MKGCCYTCARYARNFDFDNPPSNDVAQIFFRCQGKVFERPVSPICLFQSNSSVLTIPNTRNQITLSETTLKELSESLCGSLADSETCHFLCGNELESYEKLMKLAEF